MQTADSQIDQLLRQAESLRAQQRFQDAADIYQMILGTAPAAAVLALLALFKLRDKAPPTHVVSFFAAAGADIGGITGPLRGLEERVVEATRLGAVAYVPSGRGGEVEPVGEPVDTASEGLQEDLAIVPLEEYERRYLVRVLAHTNGVIHGNKGAALLLGALVVSAAGQLGPLLSGRGLFVGRMAGFFNAMTTGALLMFAALLMLGRLLVGRIRPWRAALLIAAVLSLALGVAVLWVLFARRASRAGLGEPA